MPLRALCEQLAVELNETEGWHLPAEALTDLARAVLPFVDFGMPVAELRRVIRNYYRDGPQVERMTVWGQPEGEADWEAVRRRFVSQAYRAGIPDTAAEDVGQEAWCKAREKLSTYRFRGRLEAWLSVVARNECWKWFRSRRGKRPDLPLDALDSGEESQDVQHELVGEYRRAVGGEAPGRGAETPAGELLRAERVAALKQAVERLLSGKYILILYYSFVETDRVTSDGRTVKWTDEEIAKAIDLAPGSIATIRDRILSRLRDDPDFRQLVRYFFGADWLADRTPIRKGRVRKRPVRASDKTDDAKEQS
ncbi:MAG: hypothetical protein CVU38_07665 [Chloroflexi bacterium HGW-Chloroflexi-1]|nr:MAG: hypothetical protein CVU38_07665 [Chloroflexi bacterium HGW-Chloroflexi-1]